MTRGELWWADFGLPFGSEPGFRRPVVVVQDDAFNRSKIGTTLVVPLSTNLALAEAPGNLYVESAESGLPKDSVALVSQLGVLDKRRLVERVGRIDGPQLRELEVGLRLVLGLR